MAAFLEQSRILLRRRTKRILFGGLVFGAIYVLYLAYENRQAEHYYAGLRQTDPVRYLDDLRKAEGFESYLAKFRLLEGYSDYKPGAPPFLVGRWSMKTAPERTAPGTVVADCSDPVTFEKGLVEMVTNDTKSQFQVQYRIYGTDIYIRAAKAGLTKVGLVIYGSAIDHLEFVPPGRSERVYGYLCGN